jgi:hypothetical protein
MRSGLSLVIACFLLTPAVVQALPFYGNLTVTTAAVGTAQVFLNLQPDRLLPSVLLPAGDPLSQGTVTVEFTVADPGQNVLLFAGYPFINVDETIELIGGEGPVPWDVTVGLARLAPDPQVIFFQEGAEIFSGVEYEGAIDKYFSLSGGRYRLVTSALQTGGAFAASLGTSLIFTGVPEPTAALTFVLGISLVAACSRYSLGS